MSSGKFKISKSSSKGIDKVKFNLKNIQTVYADKTLIEIVFIDGTKLMLQGDIQSFSDLISLNVNNR